MSDSDPVIEKGKGTVDEAYDQLSEEQAAGDEFPPLDGEALDGTPADVFAGMARRRGILVQMRADFPDLDVWNLLQLSAWVETGQVVS